MTNVNVARAEKIIWIYMKLKIQHIITMGNQQGSFYFIVKLAKLN